MAHRDRPRQRPARNRGRGQAVSRDARFCRKFDLTPPAPAASVVARGVIVSRPGKRPRQRGRALGGISIMKCSRAALSVFPLSVFLGMILAKTSLAAPEADYPAPKQGDFIARDFKF